jgi:hypothetical protein
MKTGPVVNLDPTTWIKNHKIGPTDMALTADEDYGMKAKPDYLVEKSYCVRMEILDGKFCKLDPQPVDNMKEESSI